MILKDGQDCRYRAAEMNPLCNLVALYFPHLPKQLMSSWIFAFAFLNDGSSTFICTFVAAIR